MSGHSLLSPSSKHRWAKCPGSVPLCQQYPDTDTVYSREGSAAHELHRIALVERNPCDTYIDRVFPEYPEFPVTQEMADYVQMSVDKVLQDLNEMEGDVLVVEQPIDLSTVYATPGQSGTGDALVLKPHTGRLVVTDLKYGMKKVSVDDNDQLMSYGAGALLAVQGTGNVVHEVVLRITQPRLNWIDEVIVTPDELQAFMHRSQQEAKQVMHAMSLHEQSGVVPLELLNPGDKQCEWCPHKPNCPALAAKALEVAKGAFSKIEEHTEQVASSSRDDIGKLLPELDLMEAFVNSVRARAKELIEQGVKIPGYKLVLGQQGHRKWSDEEAAVKMMKQGKLKIDEYSPRQAISPTAAEKLLKKEKPAVWKRLESVISRSDPKPIMVPESDKRDEYAPAVERFEAVQQPTEEPAPVPAPQPEPATLEPVPPQPIPGNLPGSHLI